MGTAGSRALYTRSVSPVMGRVGEEQVWTVPLRVLSTYSWEERFWRLIWVMSLFVCQYRVSTKGGVGVGVGKTNLNVQVRVHQHLEVEILLALVLHMQ